MKMDENIKLNHSIWTEYEIPEDIPLTIIVSQLMIWCIREKQELRIAWKQNIESDQKDEMQTPGETEWLRWAFKQQNPRIEIKPVFPDWPVLVKPENPFKIAEDASVRIYVRVPIWIRINLLGKTTTKLVEIPVVALSNTWFGTPQEGELCYWISSGARLTIEPDVTRPYMAICPIQLIDRSPEDLNIEKICLRAENLSIFHENNQLWADETKITYKGKSEISQVDFSGKAPPEAKNAKFLSEPRVKVSKSISAKTFSNFKDFSGFWFFTK